MHPAHGIGSKANKKPRRQRLGSSPRLEGGVTLYADSDWQTSPARLAESGLRTGDVAEYPIHKNQPHLRSDNVKRPASPAKNKASTIPAPQPTEAYLLQANQPTLELHRPRDILLILDLNGTLLHRMNRSKSQHFVARPHTREFLQHLLSRFSVMIWSSATPTSVTAMCRKLFSKEQRGLLVAEWARDKLGLTPQQYNQKVQVYKQLERVWDSDAIATSHPQHSAGGRWDQTNTILLDDSALKASAQPYNHISVPEFKGVRESESEKSVFNQVVGYLEAITLQRDVSSFIRKDPFEVADGWNAVDPSG
ncbi:hypothetical protein FGG08_005461 [Glutinoglossum americanum]|uniref:Mitochondrial import inner membrane translocase subunit TIM50 n=1 Tax=Glutinoglossum americanum TaxID=1670608 RepID=A0A9P8I3K4_9PEZI|nr:hypothetical protein FGG08_005461 [Glutinoglossum americanum]